MQPNNTQSVNINTITNIEQLQAMLAIAQNNVDSDNDTFARNQKSAQLTHNLTQITLQGQVSLIQNRINTLQAPTPATV